MKSTLAVTVVAVFLMALPVVADFPIPEVPFEMFTLDNGLTVIVHEDHKAPIVAVNIWYHVGSKNEKPGKTGFAHLFEHLMFNGSENFNDDYFKVLERIGATELNGTTWNDRTNYFQNVPTTALDLTLWMESDRMGYMLGAVDQARLDEQRDVVKNEKRQSQNQPYTKAWDLLPGTAYPAGHPYSWDTIGSMEDLSAASLEDVHEWFSTYYGPANAVLVLAGDIDVETARQKVEHYFGEIPSGPPVSKHDMWIAKRHENQRAVVQDRVPQSRIYKEWNVPPWGTRESEHLNLVADILANGKTSRLFKRLVYEEQIATDVSSFTFPFEISGVFMIVATAQPGGDLATVENAVNEELARLIKEGPTAEEMDRVKIQQLSDFVRSVEGIGGFGGKSDLLARHLVYRGDPAFYKQRLMWVRDATAEEIQGAAATWLADGEVAIEVHPFPDFAVTADGADRSTAPDPGTPPDADFPEIQRARLSNGLEIVLAERHAAPLVEIRLLVDAGYAADQHAENQGTARLSMDMLDEGTGSRTALEISEDLTMLGAELNTSSNLDLCVVRLSALRQNLAASLDIFADVILNPGFPDNELERLKQEQVARIQREKATPIQMALRVFPILLYGDGHAYGLPFTGSGTEESVPRITRGDLVSFHDSWFHPNNATLLVVGDTTMEEAKPLLEERFGAWSQGESPVKNIAQVAHKEQQVVYLIDKPDAEQSVIFAGHVAPAKANPNEIAFETMNTVLGGDFVSRINMNLREDKGWTYGAGTFMPGATGQRPFIVYAPVQTDKTKEAMQEVTQELTGIVGDNRITSEEMSRAKDSRTLTLPGQWETISDVSSSLADLVRFGYQDDYYDTYGDQVRALDLVQVSAAAGEVLKPDHLVWVVVGDLGKIEEGIRGLGYGQVVLIDADGNDLNE